MIRVLSTPLRGVTQRLVVGGRVGGVGVVRPVRPVRRVATTPLRQADKQAAEEATEAVQAQAEATAETYDPKLQWLHWIMAGGVLGCVGCIQAKPYVSKEWKGTLMMIHKSMGTLLFVAAGARIGLRLTTKLPGPIPGSASWEHMAGDLGHKALYAAMVIMPTTGVAMGIMGGKGLPMFGLFNIPGVSTPNKTIAGNAFKVHKKAGQVLEYALIPLHIGGALFHAVRGQQIFMRIIPGLVKK